MSKPLSIVIVDDEPLAHEVLKSYIAKLPVLVIAAGDLQFLHTTPY